MAHVRTLSKKQDGSRRYQVRYVGPDGRERAKTFGRKADADRFAASVETDKARGEWIDPRLGKTTVAEWAEGWLGRLAHVQPKTRVGYESLLKTCVLPAFGTTPLARVEQPAVAAWVAEMRGRGLSASRIRQAYRVLSSLMAAAVQGGYLARTPCAGIRLPRAARRDATLLTAAEVDRLATSAGEYGTLVYLLAYGGLRWGEVAALRRRRCDLLRRRLEVAEAVSDVNGRLVYGPTKTFERRWVRLPDFLVERLARDLEEVGPDPDEFVFHGRGERRSATRASAGRCGTPRAPPPGCRTASRRIACGTPVPVCSSLAAPTQLPSSATLGTRT